MEEAGAGSPRLKPKLSKLKRFGQRLGIGHAKGEGGSPRVGTERLAPERLAPASPGTAAAAATAGPEEEQQVWTSHEVMPHSCCVRRGAP